MDCPDSCALLFSLDKSGKPQLKGNPDNPVTSGITCKKINQHLQRLSSPSRIRTPLIREKGAFRPIGWERALALCAEKIQALRSTPGAILHLHGQGGKGVLRQVPTLFFRTLGSARTKGSLCDAAGYMAYLKDFGSRCNPDIQLLLKAHSIVNWGRDPLRSSIHTAVLIRQARRRGTRVLSISPGGDFNRSLSDHTIRIRPGTDRFLAAAVMGRLFAEGRVPAGLLERARHTESFLHAIGAYDEERLAGFCGVSTQDMDTVLAYYTSPGPTATLVGAGLQRYRYGGENVRFINALAFVSGNVGVLGGGSYFHHHAYRNLNLSWLDPGASGARTLRKPMLAQDSEAESQPPIRMIWVNGTNIVNQAPDSLAVRRFFESVDFKVVVDAFMTDTARAADLVLPCTLMLEQEDIVGSYLHEFVLYAAKVVEPPPEARSDHWIVSEIGRRLDPPVVLPDAQSCLARSLQTPAIDTDLARLRRQGWTRANRPAVAYEGLVFDHPDGRYAFPLTLHEEPPPPEGFPLRLLSLVRRDRVHSQLLPESHGELPTIWLSPQCPAWREIGTGSPVWLVSPIGRLRVLAEPLEDLHPQVVLYRRGDWMGLGGGINQLISATCTDMGPGAAYYQQYVRLEKAGP
jgi:anaerobic selenocysteine-containing dehydrogenase